MKSEPDDMEKRAVELIDLAFDDARESARDHFALSGESGEVTEAELATFEAKISFQRTQVIARLRRFLRDPDAPSLAEH